MPGPPGPAIYHLHISRRKHDRPPLSPPSPPRTLSRNFQSGNPSRKVRDSHRNLGVEGEQLFSNLNSDKARGYYSRFRGLRRDENAAIPAEINAGSPLNYTSANQLIIFFSPFRPFPPSQHRNPLPNQSPPSPPPFSLFLNLLELNRANRVRPSLLVQFLGRYSLSAFIVTIATARPPELCCSIPNKDSSLIIIFDLAWGGGRGIPLPVNGYRPEGHGHVYFPSRNDSFVSCNQTSSFIAGEYVRSFARGSFLI